MFSTRCLFVCVIFGATPVLAQTFTTPFEGVVVGRFGRPISIRNAPPKATSVSYELGQYLCAAFPGSTFFATASQRVANGEVWYRIQIASSVQAHASACPAAATGWMVGEMRDGSAVIKLTVANVAPPPNSARPTQVRPEPKESVHESSAFAGLPNYIALIASTVLTIVLITWRTRRVVNASVFGSPLFYVDAVAFSVVNVIAMAVVAPAYVAAMQTPRSAEVATPTVELLRRLTGTWPGYFALGVVLTVVLMKSVSSVSSRETDA